MDSNNLRQETYVVQTGDTLYGISKRFNTSVQALLDLNDLDTASIFPGQVLLIEATGEETPSEFITYTVQRGDNLYNIAKKYNTTVDDIKKYNNLTTNNLSIGQKLRIPYNYEDDNNTDETFPNYVSYVVERNDTLYGIARKFGTTVDKIKEDNNLTSNTLTVGSTLLIEDNTGVTAVEECFGEEYIAPNEFVIYTVQRGDSLYSIARRFNTTVSEIQKLNNLGGNISLSIGQELKIPVSSGNTSTTYIVQRGESLYSIAKKFNTTVDEIKRKNNLTSNLLSIGQELII